MNLTCNFLPVGNKSPTQDPRYVLTRPSAGYGIPYHALKGKQLDLVSCFIIVIIIYIETVT